MGETKAAAAAVKKKKGLKMPHLLFLMLGLIIFMSLMTYVIPAGQFAKNPETGALLGDQFSLLEAQTPVNPWAALLMILQGLQNAGMVVALVLIGGATIGVMLDTGAIDRATNYALYKLQDKGLTVILCAVFFFIGVQGGFGGGDQMIALVPMGMMIAKKLRLDPIIALAITFYASFIGFACGPTRLLIPQTMMGIPVYSGFQVRTYVMFGAIIIGMLYTLRYAKKVAKDPSKSAMGNMDWYNNLGDAKEIEACTLSAADLITTILFFVQYILIVWLMLGKGYNNSAFVTVQILVCVFCGLLEKMSFDQIGNSFAKGAAGMAFVGIIIGLAGTMALVMSTGNILHTIVYYACLPLRGLSLGASAIGISIVVMVINLFIPSASAKAAILIPIIAPMGETLGMTGNVVCSAFQYGDGFTNLVTPALGATAGSLALAGVPVGKWFKWALPSILIMSAFCWVVLYFLANAGWIGF